MIRLAAMAFVLLAGSPAAQPSLTLEFRIFRGSEDVTPRTRVTVHRAGERERPVAQIEPGQPHSVTVPPGIYDAQAIEVRDGRVVNIRWAERLVVMPYPDEMGHHLEVVNFDTGFGALQVRGADPAMRVDEIRIFPVDERVHPAATAAEPRDSYLFVLPAGEYDLHVRRGPRDTWHSKVEVPLDRTRFWVVP
jgi:hypothetical protein